MPRVLDSTYEDLVSKAQEMFWIHGYKGVSVQDLADFLDVSPSTIYNKYSKDMLFMDSLLYYTSNFSDPFLTQLRETTGGLDSLRDFFYKLIDALLDKTFPKSCLMVNTVVEMRNENDEISAIYDRYFEILVSSYTIVLEKAAKLGQIQRTDRIEQYADFLLGVIFSMSILYKIRDRTALREYIDEQLSFIV